MEISERGYPNMMSKFWGSERVKNNPKFWTSFIDVPMDVPKVKTIKILISSKIGDNFRKS